jgi:NADPH:quinone reductase-like Zn-dependent oxidoreductase
MLALQFDHFGPPDVITFVEKEKLTPESHQVVVDMAYAGLNPVDSKRRSGAAEGVTLPSGVGREFSGVVHAVGDSVEDFSPGDLVLGSGEGIIAEQVVLDSSLLAPVPKGLDLPRAACLPVAPQTAWCALNSQDVRAGTTVFVSGASGGVGSILAQMAVGRGATVIGSARESKHDLLRSWGVIPLDYSEDLPKGLRTLAPEGIDVVFDHTGEDTILAALELGVPRERINSTSGAGVAHNTPTVGRKGINRDAIAELGQMLVSGKIDLQVDRVFPWRDAVRAYEFLDSGQARGKIVLQLPLASTLSP